MSKKGVIWRIDDGSNVRIWKDLWFPMRLTRQPSTHRDNCELELVLELIHEATSSWKHNLLEQRFCKEDILVIISIPLRPSSEDFIVWHFNDKGTFSVK
jgi:hypothetical protein